MREEPSSRALARKKREESFISLASLSNMKDERIVVMASMFVGVMSASGLKRAVLLERGSKTTTWVNRARAAAVAGVSSAAGSKTIALSCQVRRKVGIAIPLVLP